MHSVVTILLGCSLFLFSGCGGSDGVSAPIISPPAVQPVTGIGRTGIMAGPITNFGSIIVNGVHYQTDSAQFSINGTPGIQTDLSVGQFVVVKGDLNSDLLTGTASEVIFNDNVKGPVQSVDAVQNRMVILGQTVLIDALTSFDDNITTSSLEGIQVGDIIEVSGFPDADGVILATRIEAQPVGTVFEVLGQVSNVDAVNERFSINALVIDYSAAMLDDFTNGLIENNQIVEVKGTQFGAGGEFLATRVELKTNDAIGNNGDRIEIEGLITRYVSSTDFDVSGIPVITSSSTLFEGGVAGDLGLGVKVEVEGDFNTIGQIVAVKVDIRRETLVKIEALIDSIDTSSNTITILNIEVVIDTLTRFEDKSDANVSQLTINQLNSGDFLEIRGSEFPVASGTVIAALVERDDVDTDVILQGFSSSSSDPMITLLGVMIDTTGADFEDENDNVLSRAEFFTRLTNGSLIKVKGVESSSNVIIAEEVEFEIE